MRVLQTVEPSPEQLPIVLEDRAGVAVLRGAAGSGKTTTALLRLKQLCRARLARNLRLELSEPVRVLVLTYNRSLAGYVAALAQEQVKASPALDLTVSTFASWAQELIGHIDVFDDDPKRRLYPRTELLSTLSSGLGLDTRFVESEVSYALGRFGSAGIEEYLDRDREGRGLSPRVDKPRFLEQVLVPYIAQKRATGLTDWNDVAERAATARSQSYDVVIVDEAQDFSTMQLRAVVAHMADEASTTFVLDSVQRIYPCFFTWREVGLDANRFVLNRTLTENRRNTRQIAAFARPFVEGLSLDENGQLPDLNRAVGDGPLPKVFGGSFSEQAEIIVHYLRQIDLANESVGILHPLGGGWFNALRGYLDDAGIRFVELSQNRTWPTGPVNVGLSTLHSAKGLEFDHVVVCGVTGQTAGAPDDEDDTTTQNLRRLLAMGFGRAKYSLLLCHDPSKPARVLRYLSPGTYEEM